MDPMLLGIISMGLQLAGEGLSGRSQQAAAKQQADEKSRQGAIQQILQQQQQQPLKAQELNPNSRMPAATIANSADYYSALANGSSGGRTDNTGAILSTVGGIAGLGSKLWAGLA